jgi:hypothetical protein
MLIKPYWLISNGEEHPFVERLVFFEMAVTLKSPLESKIIKLFFLKPFLKVSFYFKTNQ